MRGGDIRGSGSSSGGGGSGGDDAVASRQDYTSVERC